MISLLPDYIFEKLTDLSPKFLHDRKIALLLMDFDNTMLPYTTNTPDKMLLDWISGMKAEGITLCVVSNSHKNRVPDFCEQYGIFCVTHAKKPSTKGVVEALNRFQCKKDRAALVGDQIFTDVLGANRSGVTAIAVRSIHNHNFWLKLRHIFEVPFLAMAHKRRISP